GQRGPGLPVCARRGATWLRRREVRAAQPSMAISNTPAVAPDPRVRLSRLEDLDILVPACVAMFTEEVGYSPLAAGGAYAARVRELVTLQRSYVRIEQAPEEIGRAACRDRGERSGAAEGRAEDSGVGA